MANAAVRSCTSAPALEGSSHQTPVERRRLQPAGAFEHDTPVELGRADLLGQLIAGDEPRALAQLGAVLARHGLERRDVARRVGEVELTGALVRAIDSVVADQRFDLIEGLVDLGIHPAAHRSVLALEAHGARLELGMTMPPLRVEASQPIASFSTTTTCWPRSASSRAAAMPAYPPPTTTTSAEVGSGVGGNSRGGA